MNDNLDKRIADLGRQIGALDSETRDYYILTHPNNLRKIETLLHKDRHVFVHNTYGIEIRTSELISEFQTVHVPCRWQERLAHWCRLNQLIDPLEGLRVRRKTHRSPLIYRVKKASW